jgi:hypothetical protein
MKTKTTVEHHRPLDTVKIRVVVRRKLGTSELVPVHRIVLVCVRVPQIAGVPPLLTMDSRLFSKEGAELELWPGHEVELVGHVPILGSDQLFHGQLGWGINVIDAPIDMGAFELTAIEIGGHALPLP